MEVTVARTAGFCFGVQRAVDMVYEQLKDPGVKVYTYGPVVHNEEVIADLENKGVTVINSPEELAAIDEGIVVIRAHGVGKDIYELLDRPGITVVDATCPFVKKIHNIVSEQQKKGCRVVVAGDPDHPEVKGICGSCDGKVDVIQSVSDFEALGISANEPVCLVSQTTFNYNNFLELVEKLGEKRYDVTVFNTICSATQERQAEAKRIASSVDLMLVIGGRHSSNSQKLYDICKQECSNTYFIQSSGEFNPECVNSACSIGITAGASTPRQIIEEVHAQCLKKVLRKCSKNH